MSITGSYNLSSNDNYSEWLAELGIPADIITKLVGAKPVLHVTHSGNAVEVKTVAGDKTFTNTITLGEDSKATLPGGIEYFINLTLSGSILKGTWKMASKTGNATVEFTAAGATQTMTLGEITAKRIYARQ